MLLYLLDVTIKINHGINVINYGVIDIVDMIDGLDV